MFPHYVNCSLLSYTRFRRRTSHEPNRMLMKENKGLFSFAFDSVHAKYGVCCFIVHPAISFTARFLHVVSISRMF